MAASLGLVVYSAVKPIFKIYIIIGMGFFLAKRNILTVTTCRDISDLVVTAIMPCLIFNNVVSYLKSSDIKFVGIVFFEGTFLFIMGAVLALLTYYVCKSPKRWYGGLISVGLFPNISDLPIAYLQTMAKTGTLFSTAESNKGVAYVCIFLAAQVFYQFSLGLYKLVRYDFRDQIDKPALDDVEASSCTVGNSSAVEAPPVEPRSGRSSQSANIASDARTSEHIPTRPASEDSVSIDSADFEAKQYTDEDKHRQAGQQQSDDLEKDTSSSLSKYMSTLSRDVHRKISLDPATRRRKPSNVVVDNPLHIESSRNAESMASQDMKDIIQEYSEFDRLRSREFKATRVETGHESGKEDESSAESIPEVVPSSSKFKRNLIATLKNFLAPNSVSLITSLIVAMSPPLKALFVKSSFSMPNAPDKQPPLSFVMDVASYVGAASVPLGLLVLGATISRLRVNAIMPGFWKTAVMITACRLIILPIIGVGLTTGIYKAGWYGNDDLIRFVSVLEFGLPNATALVYFTAFYTDPNSPDHLQMDCLAICLIAQYSILFISLPFLVTFTLKVSMSF